MALDNVKEQYERYLPKNNAFYQQHFAKFLQAAFVLMGAIILMAAFIIYQMHHRPIPVFTAKQADQKKMLLTAYNEPNLLPETLLRWGGKAATVAYTFDFVNYEKQIALARPYFTEAGWQDYLASVSNLLRTIVQNQLFVTSVVSGKPVISNQGPLPNKGYTWRIQIPFLVSYQSANTVTKRNFYVVLTIVHVPTDVNPQGIGIDQFVMV